MSALLRKRQNCWVAAIGREVPFADLRTAARIHAYSITSSARPSSASGKAMPRQAIAMGQGDPSAQHQGGLRHALTLPPGVLPGSARGVAAECAGFLPGLPANLP